MEQLISKHRMENVCITYVRIRAFMHLDQGLLEYS